MYFSLWLAIRNYLIKDVPVWDSDRRWSWIHLLPRTHWIYSCIGKNFPWKTIPKIWLSSAYATDKWKKVHIQAGRRDSFAINFTPSAVTHTQEGTQNPEILLEEWRIWTPHRAHQFLRLHLGDEPPIFAAPPIKRWELLPFLLHLGWSHDLL